MLRMPRKCCSSRQKHQHSYSGSDKRAKKDEGANAGALPAVGVGAASERDQQPHVVSMTPPRGGWQQRSNSGQGSGKSEGAKAAEAGDRGKKVVKITSLADIKMVIKYVPTDIQKVGCRAAKMRARHLQKAQLDANLTSWPTI